MDRTVTSSLHSPGTHSTAPSDRLCTSLKMNLHVCSNYNEKQHVLITVCSDHNEGQHVFPSPQDEKNHTKVNFLQLPI